ncbi:Crp/Fnr family transcriptional regulator [Chroococcidiopsis sp. FACHB-1243]|uniref:Crp/Fnr family transcriptional regulator n=1 Tax=Chroococcidiopsis sp. [FACHB-1243] TaxID=2692781 RepID=UPI0017876B95|nr:Crp/Fnr family transcriptional regulator [Chroococcidiopsis sp. [FACHB-1243]]MBD2309063.1 Crp/Fnr family transcriptional regulator [Chroococcidiopsis sp. [FACHB-1243]]
MSSLSPTITIAENLSQQMFKRHDSIPLKSEMLLHIERGVVRTVTWSEEGTVMTLGYWGTGDVIGQPLSNIQPYQVECITSVEVSYVPSYQREWVLTAICRHVQQAEELLSIIRQTNARDRLLQMLLWLARKFARPVERGRLIDLRLTHQEIAEFIGMTRVSVTRLLSQLEQEGIIDRPRRHFIVLLDRQTKFA